MNILIIDDDTFLRETMCELLKQRKHIVSTAANGSEGLDILKMNSFDLVITDILMPEKDGIEIINEIKMFYPKTKILAMSAGGRISSVDYLNIAKHFGAEGILAKPFSANALFEKITEITQAPKLKSGEKTV